MKTISGLVYRAGGRSGTGIKISVKISDVAGVVWKVCSVKGEMVSPLSLSDATSITGAVTACLPAVVSQEKAWLQVHLCSS
jgi:hypothetical protein